MNKICKCNISNCGKCLMAGCKEDSCPIHTIELKIQNRRNRLSWHKSESEETKQMKAEIERLKSVKVPIKEPL